MQKLAQNKLATRYISLSHVVWLIITLLVFCALIKLGLWQLDRAQQKDARIARIEQLSSGTAAPLTELLAAKEIQGLFARTDNVGDQEHYATQLIEQLNDVPVMFNAEFDDTWLFFLDNQPNKGVFGYRVFQLAQLPNLEKENGEPLFLLINLGWVKGSIDRKVLPNITPIAGNYQLKGNIRFIEIGVQLTEQVFEESAHIQRIQQVEVDKLAKLTKKPLLPFVIYLDKAETLGFVKNWQPIVMPPEKHRGYAFQWFSLASAWLVLMIIAARKSYKNNKHHA